MSGLLYMMQGITKAVFHEAGGKWEVRLLSENEEQRLKELNETGRGILRLMERFFLKI